MALVKVYLPNGTEVNVESVDAREYVAHCGYSYTNPAEASQTAEPVVEVKTKTAKAAPAAPWTPQ